MAVKVRWGSYDGRGLALCVLLSVFLGGQEQGLLQA